MKSDITHWTVLRTEDTGLPVVVWIYPGPTPYNEGKPYLLARTMSGTLPIAISLAAVSIDKKPRHLDGLPLKEDLLKPLLEFITNYRMELLAIWNGELRTNTLLSRLESDSLIRRGVF